MLGIEAAGGDKIWAWNTTLSHNDADNFKTPEVADFSETQQPGAPKFTGEIPFTDYRISDGNLAFGYSTETNDISFRYSYWLNQQNYLLPSANVTGQELSNSNLLLQGSFWFGNDWQLDTSINQQKNRRQAGTGSTFQSLSPDTIDLDIELERTNVKVGFVHPYLVHWEGQFDMTLTYFHNKISNYIYQGNTGQTAGDTNLPIYAIEQADAILSGIEFAFHWHPSDRLALKSHYTVIDGELEVTNDILPLLPADTLFVGLDCTIGSFSKAREVIFWLSIKHSWGMDAAGP